MKLSLDLRTSLSQTLTPQQIQYLKLLQLPLVQLEQQVMQEIEQNPMLEEVHDDDHALNDPSDYSQPDIIDFTGHDAGDLSPEIEDRSYIPDQGDPFEFHKLIWQDDSSYYNKAKTGESDEDEPESYQIKDITSFTDDLVQQLRLVELTDEEYFLGEQIIGNVDLDGYLRRELSEIIDETNIAIAEYNYNLQRQFELDEQSNGENFDNPARQYALSEESNNMLKNLLMNSPELVEKIGDELQTYDR